MYIYIYINVCIYIYTYTRTYYPSPPALVHRSLALHSSSRPLPLHPPTASSFSLPILPPLPSSIFPCFVGRLSLLCPRFHYRFPGSKQSRRGRELGLLRFIFSKETCARVKEAPHTGVNVARLPASTPRTLLSSSFFFIPLNRFPGVNVLSLGCYLTLSRFLIFEFFFLFFLFYPSPVVARVVSHD